LEDAWAKPYSQDEEDYFSQAGDLYRILPDAEQARLAETIAGGLVQAETSVQNRMLEYISRANPDYGDRVREAMERRR